MQRLKEFGFEEINPGSLYRTLRQMEKEGLCKSEWETSEDGPARRIYYITDAGEAYLGSWVEACKQYQQGLDAFSRAYRSRTPRSAEHGEAF